MATKVKLPVATWKFIDPVMAESMLEKLQSQRRLISNHVAFLAREIKEGRWWINGDTLRFSRTRLLDGQHRLHAVIQAGIGIWALVVEEIEDDAYDSIDTGRNRQAGDVLYGLGYGQGFLVAATARFLYYYDKKVALDSGFKVSNHEVVETVRKYPFIKFIGEYLTHAKTMRASSIACALVLISKRVGREQTMFYAEKLAIGAELKADDPIRFFRDKWMIQKAHRDSRTARVIWIATCIKTYNAWLSGKKATMAERWASDEKWPEAARNAKQLEEVA